MQNIDEPRDCHTKSTNSGRGRQVSYNFMWKLKSDTHKFFYQTNRNRLTTIGNKLKVAKGERGKERDKSGVWD